MPDEAWCVYNCMPKPQRDQLPAEIEVLLLDTALHCYLRKAVWPLNSRDLISTEEIVCSSVDAVIVQGGGGNERWLGAEVPLNA